MSTKAEQETILRWDEEEQELHVWTASPVVERKLRRLGYAPISVGIRDGKPGSWKYRLPLRVLTIRSARSLVKTPAQAKAALDAGERLRRMGTKQPPNGDGV